jgi:hypothetical protein
MAVKGIARSLKTRQIDVQIISCSVDGTATTPAATGMDAKFIQSVADNGTGSYTITILDGQAAQANLVPIGIVPLTSGRIGRVSAVSKTAITVTFVNDAGAAADSDFILTFMHRKYGTNL